VPVNFQVVERLQKLLMLIRLTDTSEKLPDAYGYTCFCREILLFTFTNMPYWQAYLQIHNDRLLPCSFLLIIHNHLAFRRNPTGQITLEKISVSIWYTK